MVFKIRKSQYIEVFVPAAASGSQRFNFPDQPQLRNTVIDGLSVYCVADMTKTPSGYNTITEAILKKSYLTLFVTDMDDKNSPRPGMGEYINVMPFVDFHNIQSGTANVPFSRTAFDFGGMRCDWAKSYITTADGIGAGDIAFLLNVYYRKR